MKINDPNLNSAATQGLGGALQAERTRGQQVERTGQQTPARDRTGGATRDDVHLSELVRSLRALASESPERAARLEQIARAYAQGTYNVDAPATAHGIIEDALQYR